MNSLLVIFILFVAGATAADGDDCNVVPMARWAGEASLQNEILQGPVNMVVVQHTVTPEGSTDEECERILKSIRKFHRETLAFKDIGESFLICGNGRVYEGAGWGLVGAHTKGYNKKSIGLAFVGQFGSHLPNYAALAAAKAFLACGVEKNYLTSEYKLVGHRQVGTTVSPGDSLQMDIESWTHWTNKL